MDPIALDAKLYKAVCERRADDVRKILEEVDWTTEELLPSLISSFHEAAVRDAAVLRVFLDKDVNVDAADDVGDTALMLAAQGEDSGDLDEEECVESEAVEELENDSTSFVESLQNVDALIKHGANLNLRNNSGETALIQAAMTGHVEEIVLKLIEAGCDVDIADEKGYTALHHAAVRGHGNIVNILVDKQQNFGKTTDNDSVHYLACASGDLTTIKAVMRRDFDVNETNQYDRTALMDACIFNAPVDVIKSLLDRGADPNMKDEKGMTALHHAVYCGADLNVVKLLIEAKADVNNESNDDSCNSILHDAIGIAEADVIEFLIKHGASVQAVNKAGKTPAMLAEEANAEDICKIFVAHGGCAP